MNLDMGADTVVVIAIFIYVLPVLLAVCTLVGFWYVIAMKSPNKKYYLIPVSLAVLATLSILYSLRIIG